MVLWYIAVLGDSLTRSELTVVNVMITVFFDVVPRSSVHEPAPSMFIVVLHQ